MQILKHHELNASVPAGDLNFINTKVLIGQTEVLHGWIAQSEAKKAAMFGLSMRKQVLMYWCWVRMVVDVRP